MNRQQRDVQSNDVDYRVLCVCLGNICRSPTAEQVLRQQAERTALRLSVDSAGTSNYHPNKAPDVRSQKYALQRGYDLSALRARQIQLRDFCQFDWILAMDHDNLADIQQLAQQAKQQFGEQAIAQVALMSEHDTLYPKQAVPDPYYGEQADFERVLDQCETSSQAWIAYWLAQQK
ncbi:MAG: low molecular weight protein-tyrosine-phosphatase [Acinetobacter sp.]|nr:low molecular weight protein-tyrosine-phosphatase [Acinetobacter sp.]